MKMDRMVAASLVCVLLGVLLRMVITPYDVVKEVVVSDKVTVGVRGEEVVWRADFENGQMTDFISYTDKDRKDVAK